MRQGLSFLLVGILLVGILIVFTGWVAQAASESSEDSQVDGKNLLQTDLLFDIVVNGGTFSAPAAAMQAARTNPAAEVLLIEPTDWLGGQATTEGVAAIDNAWHAPGGPLMRDNPTIYYATDYQDFLDRLKTSPPEAPGEGFAQNGSAWVSREAFDPRTGAWVLDRMVTEYPNITVMKLTVVKAAETVSFTDEFGLGKQITELTLIQRTPVSDYQPFDKFLSEEITDWYDPSNSTEYTKNLFRVIPRDPAKGLVLVDGSELADLIVLSGAVYTVGRELTTEKIAEDGTLPDMDEDGSQSFVYPFCMTNATATLSEDTLKAPFTDFNTYYIDQVNNSFSLGSFSWNRVWTYRRLKNTGALWSFDTVNSGDVTMQNWYPGNDYPYGTMYRNKAEAASETADWFGGIIPSELATAEKHAIAWYFFMKANRTTTWDTHFLRGNEALNMMGTKTGLAKFPYIRGTRRIVGLSNFRITERYFVDTQDSLYSGGTSFRYYDSVGIGNYAADVHPTRMSVGISPSRHYPAPFYVPYRALGSVNVRNLLVSGKTAAMTFISNSAYRLHPIEWVMGSAAGAAAGMMIRDGSTNYDLLEISSLRALQNEVNLNSPISWDVYDEHPIPNQNGDLIVNNLNPIEEGVPFPIEVYHHRAVRAEIFLQEDFISETVTRANGRLLLDNVLAPTGATAFKAICYDAEGNEIDALGGAVNPENLFVVDNDDPRFSLTGSWTQGFVQPNKYGASYHYSYGGTGGDRATWQLYIPVSGYYEVAIWYPEANNRATDSPFTVHHANGETTFRINQQNQGGEWVVLGEFWFDVVTGGQVVLSDDITDSEQLVVADAVRTQRQTTNVSNWILY